MRLFLNVASLLLAAPGAFGLIPLETKGARFIRPSTNANSEGTEFQILGIDYQPGGSSAYGSDPDADVLTDGDACLRDAIVMQRLGINTIRVYTINPELDHDECMSIFNAAGIYVILDVNSPFENESIHRDDPEESYNSDYLTRIFKVVENFKGYPNLAGFFAGNEVVNSESSAEKSPPYIRAVQRDLKEYIAAHVNRTIPVGYSAADDIQLREAMWAYLVCKGGDASSDIDDSVSDFYGINSYQWCGDSSWTSSGYDVLNKTFYDTAVPMFFSEYGCNAESPRIFTEVDDAVYSPDGLLPFFSGGLIYEYSNEDNNYGLVEINSNKTVTLLEDFINLQNAYNNVVLPNVSESSIANVSFPECDKDAIEAMYSGFDASFDLPACPDEDLIKSGVSPSHTGSIVSVTKTTLPYSVYGTAGNAIDATLTMLADNQINSPSGVDDSSPSSTSTSTSQSTSRSAAAPAAVPIMGLPMLVSTFVLVSTLFIAIL
ncbi:glycoside hydrolase family 72 protein [Tortispora caseinolytica NRRL Y-17796]|uniref:1,3-beta-glucanosyltransferase n=1 Tax=Tortispora caseinolytica NRRL Y-17796 TaxID=767744 RepID=A0A1E4T9G4_9ASCO|nr:glycoside hydrolase family 72 protein [Tortispora caseinolytica NRRL Y-17796]